MSAVVSMALKKFHCVKLYIRSIYNFIQCASISLAGFASSFAADCLRDIVQATAATANAAEALGGERAEKNEHATA
jgi:hypothetical protein